MLTLVLDGDNVTLDDFRDHANNQLKSNIKINTMYNVQNASNFMHTICNEALAAQPDKNGDTYIKIKVQSS